MIEERKDWLLYFLGAEPGPYPTDQVRIMKGMFLLNELADHPAHGLYKFGPYDYGPFDSTVYRDLDHLQIAGLVTYSWLGQTRRKYQLSDSGQACFFGFDFVEDEDVLQPVRDIKKHVTSMSFDDLLLEIYERYPAYAIASKAQVARLRARVEMSEE